MLWDILACGVPSAFIDMSKMMQRSRGQLVFSSLLAKRLFLAHAAVHIASKMCNIFFSPGNHDTKLVTWCIPILDSDIHQLSSFSVSTSIKLGAD